MNKKIIWIHWQVYNENEQNQNCKWCTVLSWNIVDNKYTHIDVHQQFICDLIIQN